MTDDDPITRADLTRELHYMQTQVERHGFPGTRAVLAELERLHAENARLRQREDHFAKVLGVTDGGQYRNDWDARITALVAENAKLRAALVQTIDLCNAMRDHAPALNMDAERTLRDALKVVER